MGKTAASRIEDRLPGWVKLAPESFWDKAAMGDGCWEWTQGRSHGYGMVGKALAHRVSYWLTTGDDPGSLHVLHSCDNPPCVRPDHLRLGTDADNVQDMLARGRQRSIRKMTDGQVAVILEERKRGDSQRVIADRHGISQGHVHRLVAGLFRVSEPSLAPYQVAGMRVPQQVMTDEMITEARSLYLAGGVTQRVLAVQFGVSQRVIFEAVHGGRRARIA